MIVNCSCNIWPDGNFNRFDYSRGSESERSNQNGIQNESLDFEHSSSEKNINQDSRVSGHVFVLDHRIVSFNSMY